MKPELDPEFEKAWLYANNELAHITDVEHIKFCLYQKPSMSKNWNKEELDFILEAWYLITTGSCNPENHAEGEPEVIVKDVTETVVEEIVKTATKQNYKKKK